MSCSFALIRRALCGIAVTCAAVSQNVAAEPVRTPHVEAELIAQDDSYTPGAEVTLALRLNIKEHWHTYWRNPGDSGLPTRLAWTLPEGFTAGEIAWPFPKKLPLGPLMNFGYDGEVLHLVKLRTPVATPRSGYAELRAKADWLVCSDVCIPENADLVLRLPAATKPPRRDARWEQAFASALGNIPKSVDLPGAAALLGANALTISLPPKIAPSATGELEFFPYVDDLIANAGRQVFSEAGAGNGATLTIPLADPRGKTPERIDGVLLSAKGWPGMTEAKAIAISIPLAVAAGLTQPVSPGNLKGSSPPGGDIGFLMALVFAFAGGLLLNIMPCVFPVLGLKVMGFAKAALQAPGAVRRQGLAFSAGVVVSFWVLAGVLIAFRTAGEAIGWGFQLQSPLFVTALAFLFMLLALNMSGLFEFGSRIQAVAGNAELGSGAGGSRDAFFSGTLATAVATPCTAPMMGAALGFTLSQPPWVAVPVFTVIAIGMAAPVALLSFFPAWLRRLPKPGAWMETFKQALAFPLFGTVVWLVWVIGSQLGNDAVARLLFGLVLLGAGAWLYGRNQCTRPGFATLVAVASFAVAIFTAWPEPVSATVAGGQPDGEWQPYSRERLNEARAKRQPAFVDFTASWCITCQVNKRVALNDSAVKQRFVERGVVRIKADWTRQDPAITAALAEFGRNAVPLYVYYPEQGEPQVLPEILTPDIVLKALGSPGPKAASVQ